MKKQVILFLLAICIFPTALMAQGDVEKRADMAFRLGEYEDSKKLYDVAISMTPENSSQRKQLQEKKQQAEEAAKLLAEGNRYWDQGNKQAAAERFAALLKINPKDDIANNRYSEYMEDKQFKDLINNAQKESKNKDKRKAKEYYDDAAKIRPTSSWSLTQYNDYKQCKEWVAYYVDFLEAPSVAEKNAAAIKYLENKDYNTYREKIQDYLYESSMEMKDYKSALRYARTYKQKDNSNEALKKQTNRELHKIPWGIKGFIAAEVGFGNDGVLAAAAGIHLLDDDLWFNIGLGVRITRADFSISESNVNLAYQGSSTVLDSLKASISYTRLSTFIDLQFDLGNSFYISLQPTANFNSKFSIDQTRCESRNNVTKTEDYEPDGLINKVTFAIRGEFGFNFENTFRIYAFYGYNVTPLVPTSMLEVIDIAYPQLSELHHTTKFDKELQSVGAFGLGMKICF